MTTPTAEQVAELLTYLQKVEDAEGTNDFRVVDRRKLRQVRTTFAAVAARITVLESEWQRECDDADKIIAALGMSPEQARTDGGSLRVAAIIDRIKADRDRIAAETVEACAKVCEEMTRFTNMQTVIHYRMADAIASAIRALPPTRKEPSPEGKACPCRWDGDDGTAEMCIRNGHCGCVFGTNVPDPT